MSGAFAGGWLVLIFTLSLATGLQAADLKRLDVDPVKARTGAVVVNGGTLAHTAQLLPLDASGKILHAGEPHKQTETVFDLLDKVLAAAQSKRDEVVRLNVYVADDEVSAEVKSEIRRRFGPKMPAVSYVRGKLLNEQALVALDAVVLSAKKVAKVESIKVEGMHRVPGETHITFIPEGRKAYISGMAGKGELRVATDDTLKQLWSTLEFLKADMDQIVQIKAFLNPMTEQNTVMTEIAKRFSQGILPVVSIVEWTSATPVEIEMIVALPKTTEKLPVVEYLTPPGIKASPVYSRITRVNGGQDVYISGLHGELTTSGDVQLKAIFAELQRLAESAGSDLRHLVKATYYVASDDTNRRLNEIRPDYFDAARPPAASKASVRGVGLSGRAVTLDMIAVTKE